MKEKIYVVHWEGPYKWEEKESKVIEKSHVLYQIYGAHHLYGRDVLLYLGSTLRGSIRLGEHDYWVSDEYDTIKFRLGSIGEFKDWKDWENVERYKKPKDDKIVEQIESLLIYAHQPTYNQKCKYSPNNVKRIRVFNTGKLGQLFPELSSLYFFRQ